MYIFACPTKKTKPGNTAWVRSTCMTSTVFKSDVIRLAAAVAQTSVRRGARC